VGVQVGQLSVDDTTPKEITVVSDSDYQMGHSVLITTSGLLHFGPSGVTNTGGSRGALHPAGTYPFNNLGPGNRIYVVAPAGQTVTVERLLVGV
jgi:hypothetical protein